MVNKIAYTLFTAPNIVTGIVPPFLFVGQLFIDSEHDDKEGLVIKNFSAIARSASGFKLIVTAYHAIHVKGSEFFGAACWSGFILQSGVIRSHLLRKYKARAMVANIGIAIIGAAGTGLLFLQFWFPREWHSIVVPVINIITIPLEAGVQLFTKLSTLKSDMELEAEVISCKTLARDLSLKVVETAINVYRWIQFKEQKDKSGAEEILSQVGIYLGLSIAAIQFTWILCKPAIILWYKKTTRVSTGEGRQATEVVTKPNEDGNAEEHMTGEEEMAAEVAMDISNVKEPVVGKEEMAAEVAMDISNVKEPVVGKEEMAAEVAIDIGKTEEQMVGEEEMAAQVVEVGGAEEQVTGEEENIAEVVVEVEEDGNAHKQATEEGVETAGIVSNARKWLKKIYRVFIGREEEHATATDMDVGVEMVAILPLARG